MSTPLSHHGLEAALWRAVASHLELDALLAQVRGLLPGGPLLVLYRIDPLAGTARTLAAAPPVSAPARLEGVQVARAAALARGDAPLLGHEALDHALAPGVGELVVLPLADADDAHPVLLAVRGPQRSALLAPLSVLREPLRAALRLTRLIHDLAGRQAAAEADNAALRARVQPEELRQFIVGETGGLRQVMEHVDQVAVTDVPVLILGETGSGKEVVARAVHARSRCAGGPFQRINCGAIPAELVDSELFGHEKGSFTGAVASRQGWFERADGGTLFLDELGELPPAAQVRLLRVLQDGEFERVGGQKTLRVDVRIIAATHRDMREMVAEGRFREDLWYRISVFPIRLPPLRERPGDIEALALHFAERAGQRLYSSPLVPTRNDLALLASYPWPGNVRELASVIDRAAILGYGRHLDVAAALGRAAPPAPRAEPHGPSEGTLGMANRQAIEAALARTAGRIEGRHGAAVILGINPHTLRARMRKLGINWAQFRPT